jgi:membrane carboxypeptidase/penicillin-binding protein PbpC
MVENKPTRLHAGSIQILIAIAHSPTASKPNQAPKKMHSANKQLITFNLGKNCSNLTSARTLGSQSITITLTAADQD